MLKSVQNIAKSWTELHVALKLLLLCSVLTAFSSPMPQYIGWLEIMIGTGLIAGASMLAKPILKFSSQNASFKNCLVMLAIILAVPMMVAIKHDNSWEDVARDFLPSAFLLSIPILFYMGASWEKDNCVCDLIAASLLIIGVSEACRFYTELHLLIGNPTNISKSMANGLEMIGLPAGSSLEYAAGSKSVVLTQDHLLYQRRMAEAMLRMYDPAPFFAAIAMSCVGLALMLNSWRGWLYGVLLFVLGAGIIHGFLLLALRANVVLYLIAMCIYAISLSKKPGFYLRIMPTLIVFAIATTPWLLEGVSLLLLKQNAVGSNGKVGEWVAVVKQIATSPGTLLAGLGWGGVFHNPILDQPTRFTHSLITFYLLKTGVIGLGCLIAYLYMSIRFFAISVKTRIGGLRKIYLLSSIPPLIVGLLFQPSYKILSYSLVLTIFAFSIGLRIGRKKPECCI